jgi:hypothetical protein
LAIAEQEYAAQERKWIQELVEARLRVMEMEDRLRNAREIYTADELNIRDQLTASQAQLKARERIGVNDSKVNESRQIVRRFEDEWNTIAARHARILAHVRRAFVEAEEDLRLLERLQAVRRERAVRNLQAADEQVRRLHGASPQLEPATRGSVALETKVDQLLREMAELRRELRRQQTDKGQQPERRPDQP